MKMYGPLGMLVMAVSFAFLKTGLAETTNVLIDFDAGFSVGPQTPDFLSAYGVPSVTFSGAPGAMGPWIWDHASANSIVPSEPNFLMQNCATLDPGQIHRLTFLFFPELTEFSLTRVGRFGGSSTDLWTARFFNSSNVELGSFGEATLLINQPPKKFTFTAPSGETIARMDLESVYRVATTATIPVDDFVLVSKAAQTIDFPNPGVQYITNQVGLSATASSGLLVSFAVESGPGTLTNGTNLTFTGTGIVVVVASQAGDADWNAAPNVTNAFAVVLPVPGDIVTIDFDAGFSAGPQTPDFLSAYGIPSVTFSGAAGAMGPWIWDQRTSANSIVPSEPNFLIQNASASDPGQIHRLTFFFSPELKEFSLTRVGKSGGSSTDTWTARFFDSSNAELGSFGESTPLIDSLAKKFTFTTTPGETIARMDLESIYTGFATTTTIPVDDFVLGVAANQKYLVVTPPKDLEAKGRIGGPFSPSNVVYTVSNAGTDIVVWTATAAQSWVMVDPSGGMLGARSSVEVTASINDQANMLSRGVYSDTVTFSNLTSGGFGRTRGVQVTIMAPPVIHYVCQTGMAVPPFTNWATAATNIQAAIDAASIGDTVLVTNGIYDSDGVVVSGSLTSRIAIMKSITVQSVNGPTVTVIRGMEAPDGGNGDGAVRCVYIAHGAVLAGFTLTNGHTRIVGDWLKEQSGGGVLCESASAVLSNCVLTGNSACYEGGGGAYGGTLYNCTLAGNSASNFGGGACASTLYNCTLAGNSAHNDGYGGGGGTYGGALYNCTLVGNSANNFGGGTYGSTLFNCILYYNIAGKEPNWCSGNFDHCCTTPLPPGNGNITDKPQFVNAAAGDYRLLPSSPCVDRGINQDWMFDATDLAGNPRILNGMVDMGAYEFAFQGNFRVWLQGPYDTNASRMTTALNDAGKIPLTSPYADNPRRVLAIPSNATDWVLLQLRKSTNSTPFVSKSVFLGKEGDLLTDGGATNLMLEAATGTYYAVVRHRNHLAAMSANPVSFTNRFVSYDFTPDANRYYGGTNGAVRLESNAWGMIAGDADGDGEILGVDALLYDTQTNSTGYKRADFNLNGVVSNDDRNVFWSNNIGRCAAVAPGETILKPALKLNPARRTLPAESEYIFSASGGTGTIAWAFVKNLSGGTIPFAYPTSMIYRAGIVSSRIDALEAWDREDRLGRAYVNVIGSNEIARTGKAIVVAGRKSAADPLWPTTDYLADIAFNTLLYKGYGKTNIQYLNPVTNQDVDGNSHADDIDRETTLANAALAFTNWAIGTDRLFVYLVDHGGDSSGRGYFRLNESNTLTAAELDEWLDDLQNTYTTKVTVLIDCCYAGSFLDELAYTGAAQRIVIAACGSNEPTYFVAGGLVSFSDAFFGGVMRGDDVEQAWLAASNAMCGYQNACWENKGNFAVGLHLGASFVAGKDIPQIGSVMGNQLLTRTTAATLWAGDVVSVYPIERMWCLVVPPGHRPNPENPVADLPELDLTYDSSSGRYEARYEGFSEEGSYKVLFYAEDVWGSVSPPRQSYVQQSGYDERVILVAGGPTNSANWAQIDGLAQYAYCTFQARWLGHESICYLSATTNRDGGGSDDVDALVSLGNLANAIANWAVPADALTVYLIGEGTNRTLRLNETQYLSAESLNGWLNTLLVSNEAAKINVIMDFSGSGQFLPGLAATNRICIASCRADQPAIWGGEGLVSFSRYFLSGLFEGDTLYWIYSCAERAICRATGPIRQKAQLDDNGDGVSSKMDGSLARRRYIGAAFMTGADTPTIGSVTPDTVLTGTNVLRLWASGVTDMDGISNVWCVITPPNYTGVGELTKTNLTWNAEHNRYETPYTAFRVPGVYVLTFQAMDNNGEISMPLQAEVVLPDAYEPDNTGVEANAFVLGQTQTHNFHGSNDEDWVKFYAITNFRYEIETIQLGTNVDTVLDVYYELADGTLTNIDRQDNTSVGLDEEEYTWLDNPASGMYYVRVSSGNSNAWGVSSEYTLKIAIPEGSDKLVVIAVDSLNATRSPPDARAIVDGIQTQLFVDRTNCVFFSFHPNSSSTHTVEVVVATGYRMTEDSKFPNQTTNASMPIYGNPQIVTNEYAVFQFVPFVQVSTGSVIRDRWTHERLSNVKIAFNPLSEIITNDYDGYPMGASYKSHWYSRPDGTFPTNVWLPAMNYDLTLTKEDYSKGVFTNAIVNPTPGQTTNLGTLCLFPVDANTNGLADSWEERYFGVHRPPPTVDTDGDGHNNREEYLLGTDPTDRDSVLKFLQIAVRGANGVTLTWPVTNGRAYKIQTSGRLASSDRWTQEVFDAGEAAYCQTQMQWIVTNVADQTNRFYRIAAPVP